jgi:hypothetical protein
MRFAAGFVGTVAALVLGSSAMAADGADPPEVQALTNQFFGKLKSGDNAGAFQNAFKDSTITTPTSLQGIAATTGGLLTTFGGVVDWSPFAKKTISNTMILETFYVRTAEQPLFFTIVFYNIKIAWRIVDVQYGTYYNQKDRGFLVEPD